jgi:hypothetical protein
MNHHFRGDQMKSLVDEYLPKLEAIRLKKLISVRDQAKEIGVNPTTIYWMTKRTHIEMKTLRKIKDYINAHQELL